MIVDEEKDRLNTLLSRSGIRNTGFEMQVATTIQ